MFILLMWMAIFIFLFCESGARMTNQFEKFNGEITRCNWYLLSIETRRMYMVFLSNAQNPMRMRSYANITCQRETAEMVKLFW